MDDAMAGAFDGGNGTTTPMKVMGKDDAGKGAGDVRGKGAGDGSIFGVPESEFVFEFYLIHLHHSGGLRDANYWHTYKSFELIFVSSNSGKLPEHSFP